MQTSTPPNEQALLVQTAKGEVCLDPKVLKKITPAMARTVEDSALEFTADDIAKREGVSIHCINKRLAKVRGLLKVYSTFGAYRILLLARKITLK